MKIQMFLFVIIVLTLVGAGCAPTKHIFPNEANQCQQDSDCKIATVEQCTTVCPRCDTLDATSDDMKAVNRTWCSQAYEAARIAAQASGQGTTCAACVSSIENMDQIEIKCTNQNCVKVLK